MSYWSFPGVATGMYWARSMSDPNKRVRVSIIEDTKRCLRIARWAGANPLLTIPASVADPNRPLPQLSLSAI